MEPTNDNMFYNPQPMTMQGQPMQGPPTQGQLMQGQPMQGQPMQGQPMMAQPIYGQPMAGGQMMPGMNIQVGQNQSVWELGPYKHELCGCFEDIPSCLLSWCCPCIQFGQNYEQIHKDGCLQQGLIYAVLMWFGVPCIIHMGFRKEMRQKFNVPGSDLEDFLITCCCGCCALAQDAREIEYRKQEAARRGLPF